jgi:hypothetical protein
MAKLDDFIEIVNDFSAIADFVVIYVMEAHPSDGLAFEHNPVKIKTHRHIHDRLKAARHLLTKNVPCPLLTDIMLDEADRCFAAAPERLFVIQDGVLKYCGGPGPRGYHLEEVREWLENYQQSSDTK